MALILLFALFAVQALTQNVQCDFKMRQPSMTGGFVNGRMKYSFPNRFISYTFTGSGTVELYSFNAGNGFTNFDAQYKYVSAPSCGCEVSSLAMGQPALFQSTTHLRAATSGTGFVPTNSASGLTSVSFDAAGNPTTAVMTNGRTFTFSNCAAYTPAAADSTPPSGCSCGKPIDIVLVLDRSSSISNAEFVLEKQFTQNLVDAFTYGPLAVNLGITNFHTLTWDGPVTLAQGNTDASVAAGANALQCANNAQCVVFGSAVPSGSCCGSGTSISSGIVNGADMLASTNTVGFRASAAKVMIVLTDGYHNKVLKKDTSGNLVRDAKSKPQGIPYTVNTPTGTLTCGEDRTQTACVDGLLSDIQWAVNYAKQRVPTISILSVGVGDVWERSQLLAIADNKDSNVFGTTDWNQLSSLVDDLVLQTCQQSPENSNCVGCCGFCGCAGCIAPDGCDPVVNFCDVVNLQGTCCTTSPKPDTSCPVSNKCNTYTCDRTANGGQGACTSTPKPVTPNTTCAGYNCDPLTGTIVYTDLCPPKCFIDSDCNDDNACTIDKCVIPTPDPHSAYCSTTPRDCATEGGDKCRTYTCDPITGCSSTAKPLPANTSCAMYTCIPATGLANYTNLCPGVPDCYNDTGCDDSNPCTIDVCFMPGIINVSKCQYSNKDCTGTDLCMIYKCDPAVPGGCTSSPRPLTANTTCAGYTCDPLTGEEVFTDLCPPQPPCVNNSQCNDNNACTIDICIINATDALSNYCNWTDNSTNCNDGDACTVDKCEPTTGCVYSALAWQSLCNDNNACTIDSCNSTSLNATYPCSHTPVVCNATDICHENKCDPLRGCLLLNIVCPSSDNCTVAGCNVTRNEGCYIKSAGICGFPVGAVAGIAAGVIAGIVVAAVAGAFIVGGGAAYAFTSGAGAGLGATVSNNPIFTPAGEKGYNPLHKH